MDTKTAWQTLRDYAEGRIGHTYAGSCPDHVEGHDSRDPECLVCQALEAVAGAAPAAVDGAPPKGWRLVPATPTREWIAALADDGYEDCNCAQMIASILSHAPAAPALEAPAAQDLPADEFRGDTPSLVRNIVALLELDADGALVPHGVGGHARGLLSAAAARLAAAPQAPAAHVDDLAALVKKLVQALRKAAPNHVLPAQALDYLKRQGLQGSPLRAADAAPQAPAAPSGLPSGWVPCILTHDGQHPEEVAYGPQIMMDRLKKWLGRYFELLAQKVLAEPVQAEMLAALQAVAMDVVHVGAGENTISDAARAKVEAVLEKIGAPWPGPAAAPAAPAVDALGERDAAFEAVRKRLCGLQRYSFVLDDDGVVRRAQDRTGNWIEFDDAHALFDPVAVDAARAAQAKEGGESA